MNVYKLVGQILHFLITVKQIMEMDVVMVKVCGLMMVGGDINQTDLLLSGDVGGVNVSEYEI